jgi:hypothetical protein
MTARTTRTIRGTATRRAAGLAVLAATTLTLMVAACAAAPTAHLTGPGGRQSPSPSSPSAPTNAPTNEQRAEQVAAAMKSVTLTLHPDVNVHVAAPKPVTITNQAKVTALAALINDLPLFPPGTYSCPMDAGGELVLAFNSGPGAGASAVATVDLEGCEGVSLVTDGRQQPGRGRPDGGRQVAAQALTSVGLSWNLATYLLG